MTVSTLGPPGAGVTFPLHTLTNMLGDPINQEIPVVLQRALAASLHCFGTIRIGGEGGGKRLLPVTNRVREPHYISKGGQRIDRARDDRTSGSQIFMQLQRVNKV